MPGHSLIHHLGTATPDLDPNKSAANPHTKQFKGGPKARPRWNPLCTQLRDEQIAMYAKTLMTSGLGEAAGLMPSPHRRRAAGARALAPAAGTGNRGRTTMAEVAQRTIEVRRVIAGKW